jgi:hypothetical protein
MDLRRFARAYILSPLGLGSLLIALGSGLAARLLGASLPAACALGFGLLVVIFLASLALGFGQRAAFAELERAQAEKSRARLAEAADARKRLAAIRIAQPEVAAARDLLVLEAGSFVEGCGRAGTYDPEGVAAIVDSLALVDAWLKEADESSIERRFDLPDANPFPEAAERTARALRDKALLVAARRSAAVDEVPGADRIAIQEELK